MRAVAEPARTETVWVTTWRQARQVIAAWRGGVLGMTGSIRHVDQLQRLFEVTGTLRLRAWRRKPLGCSEAHSELVELVVKRSQG